MEWIQQQATERIQGLENSTYQERLEELETI